MFEGTTVNGSRSVACLMIVQVLMSAACSHKAVLNVGVPSSGEPQILATPPKSKAPPLTFPLKLEVRGEEGRKELTHHCSTAVSSYYDRQALRRQKIERVEFKTDTLIGKTDPKTHDLFQLIATVEKDGAIPLHDLAFPEVGEQIDFIFTPTGQVVKAGNAPKGSLFFVAPLPFPEKPVVVGSKWRDVAKWKSLNNSMQFTAVTDSEVTGQKPCGISQCVVVRVTGEVHMPEKVERSNHFKHRLGGTYLYEPLKGILVWAEFASTESIMSGGDKVEVVSRLRSALEEPKESIPDHAEFPACPLPEQ